MKRTTWRRALVPIVGLLGLALAGQAVAAFSPASTATTNDAGASITYSQAATDDPAAVVTFYVPAGFTATFADVAGTTVGSVSAKIAAVDLGSGTLPFTGTIVAAAATDTLTVDGVAVPLSTLATNCTGKATHSAFWILNLSGAGGGKTLQVVAFADDVPVTNTVLSPIADDTIAICLAPPDVPTGTPGRAALGAKFVSLTLDLSILSTTPDWYVWNTKATPYTPATGLANTAGTVVATALDRTPQEVSLKVLAAKKGGLVFTGRVRSGGLGVAGASVSIMDGTKVVATGKTVNGSGAFAIRVPSAAASGTYTATASVESRSLGGCVSWFPPATCTGLTTGAFTVSSGDPVGVGG